LKIDITSYLCEDGLIWMKFDSLMQNDVPNTTSDIVEIETVK